jgi:uncharacterized DUF497 family protein
MRHSLEGRDNVNEYEISYELDGQKFIWDSDKADNNIVKHGIAFEEAASVFIFDNVIYFEDTSHSENENRFIAVGMSEKVRILMVCHCMRENDEVIRIISARKATNSEKQTWKEENNER